MKRLIPFIACAVLAATTCLGQKESVFTEEDTWNLYTKPIVSLSELGDDDTTLAGLEIGGINNEKLAVGVRVSMLVDDAESSFEGYQDPESGDLIYGGLALEYTFWGDDLFHFSVGLLGGIGQLDLKRRSGTGEEIDLYFAEPSLNTMINLTTDIEVGLGVAYRVAEAEDFSGSDLSGWLGSLFVRFKEF